MRIPLRKNYKSIACLLIPAMLIAVLYAVAWSQDTPRPQLTIKVGDIQTTGDSSYIRVPVYMSNPMDTVAGVEFYFRIMENHFLNFALDDRGRDRELRATDTAGSLISGWEYVGSSSLEKGQYDLKIAAMANWPGENQQPPLLPQENGVLLNIGFDFDKSFFNPHQNKIDIELIPDKTSISDIHGRTVGIITYYDRECIEWAGDTCKSWRLFRVGTLDTNAVKFQGGSITVIDSLEIQK